MKKRAYSVVAAALLALLLAGGALAAPTRTASRPAKAPAAKAAPQRVICVNCPMPACCADCAKDPAHCPMMKQGAACHMAGASKAPARPEAPRVGANLRGRPAARKTKVVAR